MSRGADVVVWDFNGTLFDDVEADILSANDLLSLHGLPTLKSREEYRSVFCFPITKYYENIGFDFNKVDFVDIAHEWVRFYRSHEDTARIMDGAAETVAGLKSRGVKQFVISASEEKLLKRQLSDIGLLGELDGALGIGDIYAGSKVNIALAWRERFPDSRVLFVGDTLHDLEVAREIDASCVLFDGGHQSRERLLASGAPVIDDLKKVLDMV